MYRITIQKNEFDSEQSVIITKDLNKFTEGCNSKPYFIMLEVGSPDKWKKVTYHFNTGDSNKDIQLEIEFALVN